MLSRDSFPALWHSVLPLPSASAGMMGGVRVTSLAFSQSTAASSTMRYENMDEHEDCTISFPDHLAVGCWGGLVLVYSLQPEIAKTVRVCTCVPPPLFSRLFLQQTLLCL